MIKEAIIPYAANEHIKVWIDGKLHPREEAKVSVFDSLVQGGDGVWEGLRVYDGRVFMLDAHINRMLDSAKAMAFTDIPSADYIRDAVFETLKANGMRNHTHIRMTLSRGLKVTSGMSPHWNQYGSTLIVVAEWKPPIFDRNGVRLISSTIRRNTPACLDSKIHHNNLINNILAKVESNLAGADDAVMLDVDGFVAETNATNIFFVKKGKLRTPHADACLPGITRGVVLDIARRNDIPVEEARISIAEMYSADEVFITGTMGELVPVLNIDGRSFEPGELTGTIQSYYLDRTKRLGTPLPEFEGQTPELVKRVQ